MTRLRIAVHALDRTGPPMLALAFVRWLAGAGVPAEVVAFRGGELLDDFVRLAPTVVLLDPSQPWDHAAPDPRLVATVRRRATALEPADATLLVSVSAAQALPYLPPGDPPGAPVVAWVVERGEDLHWLDGPLAPHRWVTRWLAGAEGIRTELRAHLHGPAADAEIRVVGEFVADASPPAAELVQHCRRALGVAADEMLVVGGGIATVRKAPDLFVEVALAHARAHGPAARFVWFGGESDVLFEPVSRQIRDLGLANVRMMGSVVDVTPWLAAADVFLHPARLDAFPLICLHAALAGTPVVGFSGAGGLVEMFGDAFAGAPYPDVAGLAAALGALEDPHERSALGRRQAEAAAPHVASRAAPVLYERLCAEVAA